MEVKISQLFDYGDEIAAPGEVPAFDPGQIKELTMQKIHGEHTAPKRVRAVRRASRTLLIAAAIASLFTVTALAAGLSVHQRRQAQLRDYREVDANSVTDYVEYETGEDAAGVTLLSALNTGEMQEVYLNIGPVSPDEVFDPGEQELMEAEGIHREYVYELDGDGKWNWLQFTPSDWDFAPEDMVTVTMEGGETLQKPSPEAIHRKLMDSCYDAESRTLTLMGHVPLDRLREGKETQLHVVCLEVRGGDFDHPEIYRDFGSVAISATEHRVKTVMFDTPPVFTNEETGDEAQVLGVELSYEGVTWLVSFDGMAAVHGRPADDLTEAEKQAYFDLQLSWLRAEDQLMWNAKLNFADGSSMEAPGILRSPYEDGAVKLIGTLGTGSIDVNKIVSVTVCGETIAVS